MSVGRQGIARGTTPKQILAHFRDFYGQIHETLPGTRIYVPGIVPSPGDRFKGWESIKLANRTLEKECDQQPWLTFIDTTSGLIGQDGKPRLECFLPNNIHMNSEGYAIWATEVAPVVLKVEQKHEEQKSFAK